MPEAYVTSARDFAYVIHDGQLYGEHPYPVHLAAAVAVASRFGLLTLFIEAAIWLHDSKEDRDATDARFREIGMPEFVIVIVDGVTDEAGTTRKERKTRTYPKTVKLRECVIVKLVERIASVEDGAKSSMYAREHAEFRKALYRPEHKLDAVWEHLDGLLFPA